jgi:predicted neutral ceramidase superfamily lipid hydrolase
LKDYYRVFQQRKVQDLIASLPKLYQMFLRFLTGVHLFMSLKTTQIRQGFPTLFTDTDIFSTVILFMSSKATVSNESFATFLTYIGTLLMVTLFMCLKVTWRHKDFPTLLIVFFTSVGSFTYFKVSRRTEGFPTLHTYIKFLSTMCHCMGMKGTDIKEVFAPLLIYWAFFCSMTKLMFFK